MLTPVKREEAIIPSEAGALAEGIDVHCCKAANLRGKRCGLAASDGDRGKSSHQDAA